MAMLFLSLHPILSNTSDIIINKKALALVGRSSGPRPQVPSAARIMSSMHWSPNTHVMTMTTFTLTNQ